ncbi:proto-oncogene c-Fos-like [Branchiostoma floridae]|uniref:Proto-oncogene c-Fos-like n=1 Tax=Branchiostoma floridae TaxID=7739 RepID=A0A9J7L7A6_BRAFL|nr:proto-oncogene c-Fos-like [Branchiostoma floridae]
MANTQALPSDDSAKWSDESLSCTTSAGSTDLPNFQLLQDLSLAQQMSTEEDPRATRRRERNRLAAARCRERRRERAEFLRKETLQLENRNQSLRANISRLRRERERLKQVLESHMTTHHGEGTSAVPTDQDMASSGSQGAGGACSGDEAIAILHDVGNNLSMGGSLLVLDDRSASLGNEISLPYGPPHQPIMSLHESRQRTREETNC